MVLLTINWCQCYTGRKDEEITVVMGKMRIRSGFVFQVKHPVFTPNPLNNTQRMAVGSDTLSGFAIMFLE
jgi:hypothetical protein